MPQPRQHAGQGPGKICNFIAPHRNAHRAIPIDTAVCVDHQATDLRRQSLQSMLYQGNALKGLHTFIDAAHAAATAAGKN